MIIGNSDSKEEPSDVAIFFLWNGSDLTIFINMFGLLELPAKYADIGGIWGDLYNNDLLWWLAALSPTHYMLILLWTCPGVVLPTWDWALAWLTSLNKKISILFILWIFMLQPWLLSNIRSYSQPQPQPHPQTLESPCHHLLHLSKNYQIPSMKC